MNQAVQLGGSGKIFSSADILEQVGDTYRILIIWLPYWGKLKDKFSPNPPVEC